MISQIKFENLLNNAISKGVRSVIKHPPSASLVVQDFIDVQCKLPRREGKIISPLGLLLNAFSNVDGVDLKTEAKLIAWIDKGIKIVNKEGKDIFSINYWIRGSKYFKELPLPDDLDDVALIIAALTLHKRDVDERYFLKMLTIEEKEGGPYRTWYLGDLKSLMTKENKSKLAKWLDVDPAVNAHALYATKLYGIELKRCRSYVVDSLKGNKISSPYYLSDLIFLYYVSKYLSLCEDRELLDHVKNSLKTFKYYQLSSFEKIWHILIRLYLNEEVHKEEIVEILKLQKRDGSLPPLPIFNNFPVEGKPTFTGSRFITASYFIELLAKYQKKYFPKIAPITDSQYLTNELTAELIKEVRETSIDLDEFKYMVEKNELLFLKLPIKLAYQLKTDLNSEEQKLVNSFIKSTIYTSLAYSYIDYIQDGEFPHSKAVNIAMFLKLGMKYIDEVSLTDPKFKQLSVGALQISDTHYAAWAEVTKLTKRGDEGVDYIRARMAAYIKVIGYLPRLLKVKRVSSSKLEKFIENLLIIRQLNDDAHDWEDDLKNGQSTYVVKLINRKSKGRSKPELKKYYMNYVTTKIISLCKSKESEARQLLLEMKLSGGTLERVLEDSILPIDLLKSEKIKVKRIQSRL